MTLRELALHAFQPRWGLWMRSAAWLAALLGSQAPLAMAQGEPVATLEGRPALEASNAANLSAPAGDEQSSSVATSIEVSPEQPQQAVPTPAEHQGGVIEEIIVTAQKRQENMQDVPIAISAFTGDQLQASGVTNISDIASKTAGVLYDSAAGYAIIFIRGVGTDAFLPSVDMSVATYVDGVYFPFSFGLARALGDIERVEVLKGPQGTLFGTNASAGAINIVTKNPSTDSWKGSFATSFGNYSEWDNALSFSGPLGSALSMSGGLLYNAKHEYYDYVEPSPHVGKEPQKYRDLGANLKLRWVPSDYVDATLQGYLINARGANTLLLVNLEPSPLAERFDISAADEYKMNNSYPAYFENTAKVGSLTVAAHPGPLDIKSISAYQTTQEYGAVDFDGSSANLVGFGSQDRNAALQSGHVFTQELQLLSNDESLFADYISWVAGLYYLKSDFGFPHLHITVADLQEGLAGLDGGTYPGPDAVTVLLNRLGTVLGAAQPIAGADVFVSGHLKTTSKSAYTQWTFSPTDWVGLTLGTRVQKTHRTVYDATSAGAEISLLDGVVNPAVPLFSYPSESVSETTWSPKGVLDFKPTEGVLLYASYQRAYQSPSFNILNLTTPPTEVRTSRLNTVEVGAKTDLFDKRVRLNAAAYRNRIHDLQSQFLSLLSGGVVQFQNADLATIKGADVDLSWMVVPGLKLGAGATYLASKYNSFPEAKGYDESTGIYQTGLDYSGNRIVRNPRWSVTSDLEYSFNLERGVATIGADYYYNSGYFYDAANVIRQNSYSLLGARASYLYEPWNIQLSIFGENLTGEKYYLYKFQTDFGVVGKLAMPETYGMRVRWDF